MTASSADSVKRLLSLGYHAFVKVLKLRRLEALAHSLGAASDVVTVPDLFFSGEIQVRSYGGYGQSRSGEADNFVEEHRCERRSGRLTW